MIHLGSGSFKLPDDVGEALGGVSWGGHGGSSLGVLLVGGHPGMEVGQSLCLIQLICVADAQRQQHLWVVGIGLQRPAQSCNRLFAAAIICWSHVLDGCSRQELKGGKDIEKKAASAGDRVGLQRPTQSCNCLFAAANVCRKQLKVSCAALVQQTRVLGWQGHG